MDEIFRISDDITVYRDGEYIASDRAENLNVDKLIQLMVGREVSNMFPKVDCPIGDTILKVENLSAGHAVRTYRSSCTAVKFWAWPVWSAQAVPKRQRLFSVCAISPAARSIRTARLHIKSPSTPSHTKDRPADRGSTRQRHRRYAEHQGQYRACQPEKLRFPAQSQEDARGYRRVCSVSSIPKHRRSTPPSRTFPAAISRRVLVGRWLLTDPDILIVDEPTRGIDVGAKAEIHSLITKLAGEGKAIIVISSELPEVMGMSDRIVVMHEGTMTAIVDRKDFSSELILKYATSEVPYQPAADEQ